ncbi:hypothetical protein JW877_07450 [bacterium]|nr:hypothetical protein [bacterium]
MSDIIRLKLYKPREEVIQPEERRKTSPFLVYVLVAVIIMALGVVGYNYLAKGSLSLQGFLKKEKIPAVTESPDIPVKPTEITIDPRSIVVNVFQKNGGVIKLLSVLENMDLNLKSLMKNEEGLLFIEGYADNDSAVVLINKDLGLSDGLESITILFTEKAGENTLYYTQSRITIPQIENEISQPESYSIPPYFRAKTIRTVDSLAVIAKMTTHNVKPLEDQTIVTGKRFLIVFEGNGSLASLRVFLEEINKLPVLVEIVSLGITYDSPGRSPGKALDAKVVLGLHYFQPI